jgi:hypothetical protein
MSSVIHVFPQIISYNSRWWSFIPLWDITSYYCGYTIKHSHSIDGKTFGWSGVDLVIFKILKWLWWLFAFSHVCRVATLVIKVIDTLVTCALLLRRIHLVTTLLKANYNYCYLTIGCKHDKIFQKLVLRKFN